ncbi:MAG TPA: hypothetical protein DD444_03265 [Citreicella sp.]|jgi:hypothetical protein|uniref:Uncharacterized protein n=1 Tax=Salipiger marinus TaxID=555512 RepID=A0A1G8UT90_9RHOB|nr:hypothetical protein [Salipiger marinus]SDJ57072.1 hypothetical protein SAMN04487993_10517 [Salipiger marinus]HBM58196.1 hypothetical protein [Citreicella sp.]
MSRTTILTVCLTMILALGIAALALAPTPILLDDRWMGGLLEHVLSFALLMVPAALLRPAWLIWLWPTAAVYAGGLELLQPQFGRNGAPLHWVSSCFGLTLITLSTWLVQGVMELSRAMHADTPEDSRPEDGI